MSKFNLQRPVASLLSAVAWLLIASGHAVFSADNPPEVTPDEKTPAEREAPGVKRAVVNKTRSSFPQWKTIELILLEHFNRGKKRSKNELISQQDLNGLFETLARVGWRVSKRRELTQAVLPDRDFLVRQLRTPRGRRFMQKISKHPGAYDRIDRLRRMPYGQRRIRELISTPGGDTLIEYMTTTRYGQNLGQTLSRAQNGRRFNQPTDRIYTPTDMIGRLKTYFDDQAANTRSRRANASSRTKSGPARGVKVLPVPSNNQQGTKQQNEGEQPVRSTGPLLGPGASEREGGKSPSGSRELSETAEIE